MRAIPPPGRVVTPAIGTSLRRRRMWMFAAARELARGCKEKEVSRKKKRVGVGVNSCLRLTLNVNRFNHEQTLRNKGLFI
jgi:hypothetical protein